MQHGRSKNYHYLGKDIRVFLKPTGKCRSVHGTLQAFDQYMNLVVVDALETREVIERVNGSKTKAMKTRNLGFVLIRGTEVLSMSLEGESEPIADTAAAKGTA
ncbi:hypothetical protein XU18_3392 [Perkinsela sp. CCAP 1560/4]|nr:hypothetical protein XU18_3392 [Perkinsela sp. CCAP 1560/4]|eukprot:KNH05621.1 hypothetical protein XU18_3392 [Perkinsela sp. CCAP 1560/4]